MTSKHSIFIIFEFAFKSSSLSLYSCVVSVKDAFMTASSKFSKKREPINKIGMINKYA